MASYEDSNSAEIPIVDLHGANAGKELLDAAIKFGFIYIKHTDTLALRLQDVDNMFKKSREFFAASKEVKTPCLVTNNHGWVPMNREKLDPVKHKKGDFKECFNVAEYIDGKAQQPLPEPLESYEQHLGEFVDKCHSVCNLIMALLAKALEILPSEGGEDWFYRRHDKCKGPTGSILRLLYYPVLPGYIQNPEEDIRAGAHSDYGSVTLLFRLPGQPGLEILTTSGTWASVPVDPEPASGSSRLPILVNIGDILSYWTNGLLKSTVHRVIFPSTKDGAKGLQDRYSIAYFCHPEDAARLVEIPSALVQEQGRKVNGSTNKPDVAVTAREYLNHRLTATYATA